MPSSASCHALMIHPRFNPNSFWNYRATCEMVGARYPAAPLGIITVAALLPPSWEVRLVNRNTEELTDSDLEWADLVMTGGMLPQQRDTLRIIEMAKARGKPVVVGGPDATSSPHVYAAADFQVLGEAEELMEEFASDWAGGRRRGTYKAPRAPDMTRSPVPRFDLLKFDQYLHVGVQYSRGCPFNCEFCDIIELYGRVPRVKTTEQILRELDALYDLGYRGHVDFVDDNLIGNKKALKGFLPELRGWLERRRWPFEFTTEASVNLADDPVLLDQLKKANFFAIFVGIESPDPETLIQAQKHQNTRRVLAESIGKIHAAGIWVNAGFIVGFDSERASAAEGMIQCIEDTSIPVCMVGLLYALPNTQLTRRLLAEGRLHPDGDVVTTDLATDQCTAGLNFETLRPRRQVLADYRRVLEHAYAPDRYFARVRRVGRELDCSAHKLRVPLRNILRDLRAFGRMMVQMGVLDPEVRREWWRTILDCALHNPRALKSVASLAALYRHLGPFARYVTSSLTAQIKAIDDEAWTAPEPLPMPAVRAAGSSPRPTIVPLPDPVRESMVTGD